MGSSTNDRSSNEKEQLHIRMEKYLKEFLSDWAERECTTMSNIIVQFVRKEWENRVIRKRRSDVEQI
jgi:hypothetical protein